jgi:UDPglucose 6-dehydrogenase
VQWLDDPYEAAKDADLIVLLTEWNEFRALDLGRIAQNMARPAMADLRNIYNATVTREAGFVAYDSVGRIGFS